jgi:translation initiation factor 2B subunit (eIF-2B alpha/beta/delta family)
MSKTFIFPIILLFFFTGGVALGYAIFRCQPSNARQEATVLLESIRTVAKLVTVQGQFSEIYDHNAYQGYWTWLYDKKILVRVKATVSAGIDLDALQIDASPATKTITIGPIPPPQILSIDHDVDYFDIREGLFTRFTPNEYNQINKEAKHILRKKAEQSPLLTTAADQSSNMIQIIQTLADNAGWKVIVRETKPSFSG